jgi:hypothetical protein
MIKNFRNPRCLLLILQLVLLGCANLSVYQPTGLHEIPEISGSTPGNSFDLGVGTGYNYEATSDASVRPLIWNPSAHSSNRLFGRIRFPLQKYNVELGAGAYVNGIFGLFKYQFLGPNFFEAKKNDMSLALLARVSASAGYTQSGDSNGLLGGTGYPWKGEINARDMAVSLVYGFRVQDSFLLYGGGLYSASIVNAHVKHSSSTDGTSPAADYDFADKVNRSGPVLGFLYNVNNRFSLHIEATYLNSALPESNVTLDPECNLAGILRFDLNRPESTR